MNMKKTNRLVALFLALVLALSMAACGNSATDEAAEDVTAEASADVAVSADAEAESADAAFTAYTVTDMTGREVTIEEPVERIVILTASDCEILYALGAGDLLVGRGEYCDYPEEVYEITSVESGSETNIEQILALDPQVLIMATMAQTEEQVAALEEAGVKVVCTDASTIEDVYTEIELVGAVVGKDAEAAAIVESMQTAFAELTEKAAAADDGEEKTVYFEVSPLEYGLWAAGNGTFMNEIAEMIGLTNIFADLEGWAEVSEEEVLSRNPDYIVTISMYYGEGPTPTEEILARTGWENVTAVQNEAILNLQNNELSRPAPRLTDGAEALYELVYGE